MNLIKGSGDEIVEDEREETRGGSNMPMIQRLSDIVDMRVTKNDKSQQVLEIQSRFIKIQLIVDDLPKAKQLEALIKEVANPVLQQRGEAQPLPKFYKNKKSEQP